MILVIDTSAPRASFVATIDGGQREEHQAPRLDLEALRKLARERPPAKVAVATGPGSFTGLRVGVSFGLGLAMGLRIPILALPTLELQAARTDEPATAVVDAGRGRYYYKLPGQPPWLAEPAAIPPSHPLVGTVADRRSLIAGGHRFVTDTALRRYDDAAARHIVTARDIQAGNHELEYMPPSARKYLQLL